MSTISSIKEPAPQYTASGEMHGLVKVISNSVPEGDMKRFKEKDREGMKKKRADESRLVKAICINTKDSTRRLPTVYCNWEGDPLLHYRFIPDHEYELPKGLVDQVNTQKKSQRSGLLDPKGNPIMKDQTVPGEWRFVSASGF